MMDLQSMRRILGGRISNGQLYCPGPGHSRRDRSLSIKLSATAPDGFVVKTFSSKDDALACKDYIREKCGLPHWRPDTAQRFNGHEVKSQPDDNDQARMERARAIWSEAQEPRATIAEAYLASRGLELPRELCGGVLRFHPNCPWEGGRVPCLIAAFRAIQGDEITAVHRIRLDQPRHWPKTERRMLGVVAETAIKLDAATNVLAVGEGLESCLASRELGMRPVWALGSAGAIEKFQPIDGIQELAILGERDEANHKAASACRGNWQGRRVFMLLPRAGKDFNDFILERVK